jgi:chaperone modulatory protein CbpM
MRPPPPKTPHAPIVLAPRLAEVFLSRAELARAAGISRSRLVRLVRLGIVEPAAPGTREFTAATAARLRRMMRIHVDLEVTLDGAAIIVDLLERLERLEMELARWRGDPGGRER